MRRMAEPDVPPTEPPATEPALGLTSELAAWKDRALRARADYDNLVRRTARDSAAERDRAKARVLEGFLPVFELAQMAAHQAEAHPSPISEGIVLMAREFGRLLEREGLVRVGEVGEPFSSAVHDAVAEEPAPPGVPPGNVARVVLPGYKLGERVLRHAKVTVALPTVP